MANAEAGQKGYEHLGMPFRLVYQVQSLVTPNTEISEHDGPQVIGFGGNGGACLDLEGVKRFLRSFGGGDYIFRRQKVVDGKMIVTFEEPLEDVDGKKSYFHLIVSPQFQLVEKGLSAQVETEIVNLSEGDTARTPEPAVA